MYTLMRRAFAVTFGAALGLWAAVVALLGLEQALSWLDGRRRR